MDLNPKILQRFFVGKYSRKDFLTIRSYFENSAKEEELKDLLQSHWFDFQNHDLPEGNINNVLDKIHQQIQLESSSRKRIGFIRVFQKIAAILIVPLALAFLALFYNQSKTTAPEIAMAEIQCPLGARTKFVLPDGTTGFLNSGSTLEYPVSFASQRNVVLNGEAFFDVTHDEKHPFTVKTPHLSTKVLGTQFNVIAYKGENLEEIVLKEGIVEVYSAQGDKLETLQPNQQLLLNTQTSRYNKNNIEAGQYVSWTEGKLVLRNEDMEQVAKRLGRWYNVDIEISDEELLKYSFRATFMDEPVEEVLKLLAITAPLTFKEQKRETTNNNTFKKRKILVSIDRKRIDAF